MNYGHLHYDNAFQYNIMTFFFLCLMHMLYGDILLHNNFCPFDTAIRLGENQPNCLKKETFIGVTAKKIMNANLPSSAIFVLPFFFFSSKNH